MGLITRIRSLWTLPSLYGLTGNDHANDSIDTSSPIVVVHDTSREAELARIAQATCSLSVQATATGTIQASGQIAKSAMSPAQALTGISDADFTPWLIGFGFDSNGVAADWTAGYLWIAPASIGAPVSTGATGTTPITNIFLGRLQTGIGFSGGASPVLYELAYQGSGYTLPMRVPWGSFIYLAGTCATVDVGKFLYARLLVMLLPNGSTPPGMR